jgi:two-component system sensor histidine kinase HydH
MALAYPAVDHRAAPLPGRLPEYTGTVNTLIYMLAALLCGTFAIRAWSVDRRDPLRRAFMLVGGLCGVYYGSFTLYLLPGFPVFDYIHAGAGAFLPAAVLGFFGQLLRKGEERGPITAHKLWAVTPLIVAAFVIVQAYMFSDVPRASVAEVVLAGFVFGGFVITIRSLWHIQRTTENQVDRARLGYLLSLLLGTVLLSALEALIRNVGPVSDITALSIVSRSMVLQGAFPPVGAVCGTMFCYFLYQVVEHSRLLDLYEVFARLFTLAVASLVLVAMDGITVLWIGSFSDYPVHATFQIFLASILFLGLYDPLRRRIETAAGEWFNRQGRRLELTLQEIDRDLRKVISITSLEHHIIGRLQQSGRVPQVSLYLWNQERGLYDITLERGQPPRPLMRTIAQRPFTDGFLSSGAPYNRSDLDLMVERRVSGHEDAVLRLRTMDTMAADLTLPIISGDLVLGWLNFRDESWSDGYSAEEVRRLTQTVNRVAVVLENIFSFEQLKEQTRLAALGTMSAGLAHEIRNPLAGIKGAAQYLQGGADQAEVPAFLKVIVDETDRLDTVVSQFLAYARPFEIHAEPALANNLVRRVMDLVRAEGLPEGVKLSTELAPGIPPIHLDPDKLRQVLLNLVKNALHAIDGDGDVTVRTGLGTLTAPPHRGNPAFVVSVQDSGEGIAPENLEKLFIPFFTTKPDGTGLGLAISRRLVEAHGGEIAVQSNQEQGTTFTVRLPIRLPDIDSDQTLS